MKKFSLALIAVLIASMVYFQLLYRQKNEMLPAIVPIEKPVSYHLSARPLRNQISRIGLNLGQWTSWGAQQYMRNVLKNPGFEENIHRLIVIVEEADPYSFADELGRGFPDGTWSEAGFEVLSGEHAGLRGKVQISLESGDRGFPRYFTHEPIPKLEKQSVVVLTKNVPSNPVSNWWTSGPPRVMVDPDEKRTNSPGSQSLKLLPDKNGHANVDYFLDTLVSDVGKFLTLEQVPWRLTFWAKASHESIPLEVSFRRLNDTPYFFQKTFPLTTEWQEFEVEFTPKDEGKPGPLKFSMTAVEPVAIWVDDVRLGTFGHSAFRPELVSALQELRPAYLREPGHLADGMENSFATPFARKPWAVFGETGEYSYSLGEFFDLCEEIGASPWLIVPPTFTDEENMRFGEFLAEYAGAKRFPDVILEFGCENWNWAYRATAIPYHDSCGEVAGRAFEHIQSGTKEHANLRKFVNGQHAVPWRSLAFLDETPNADGLAIAPFFFYTLETNTPDAQILAALFSDDAGLMQEIFEGTKERQKDLAVYAVNLHTTQGSATKEERERVVASAAAGSALAKRLLEALSIGADPIMVYNFSQYDTSAWDLPDRVKLWGITRDLGSPVVFRPTGLALQMFNRVLPGDLYEAFPDTDSVLAAQKLTIAAFKTPYLWTCAMVSAHALPVEVIIEFPDDGHPLPTTQSILSAERPFDTNEKDPQVAIAERAVYPSGRKVRVTVPAWSFVTLGTHLN